MGNCTTACEMDSFKDATQRDPQDISMVIDYNEKGFVLPSEILFNHQSTFTKIEKVSREFCESTQT